MVRRVMHDSHVGVVYDRAADAVQGLVGEGATGSDSLADLVAKLEAPRHVWVMVPAGAATEATVQELGKVLSPGDCIIDGGNSYYKDDVRRSEMLRDKGIHYLDVGTSGGVWGLERGYCLMIGGTREVVERMDPIFSSLAPGRGDIISTPGRESKGGTAELGYLYCGPSGAGHFVKMVHNGIEYGLMQAYAEGLNVLKHANIGLHAQETDAETTPLRDPDLYKYELDVSAITEVWRRGSVIASWLLDLTAEALYETPELEEYAGRVSDSGEGRWTVQAAIEEGVPTPVLAASLFDRFASRGEADWGNRVLSAMRKGFGGHLEKSPEQ